MRHCAFLCALVRSCATLCHLVRSCASLCDLVPPCAILCILVRSCAILCHFVRSCAILCHLVLSCAILCFLVRSCAVLCDLGRATKPVANAITCRAPCQRKNAVSIDFQCILGFMFAGAGEVSSPPPNTPRVPSDIPLSTCLFEVRTPPKSTAFPVVAIFTNSIVSPVIVF